MCDLQFLLLSGKTKTTSYAASTSAELDCYRQLEAVIRISESLAKLRLSPVATSEHVEEAIRLFKLSTMEAVQTGVTDGVSRSELMEEVQEIENEILRRLPMGSTIPLARIKGDLLNRNYKEGAIMRALAILGRREVLQFRNQGNMVFRQGA